MAMKPEILVHALQAGETERYTEQLISSQCKSAADVQKVMRVASKDGWHSFRVATWDGSAPDFTNVLEGNRNGN